MRYEPRSDHDNPCSSFIDRFNPPFWVLEHLSEKDTYVVYRDVGGNIYKEIKVWVVNKDFNTSSKLTPEERLYFKRHLIN